MEACAILKVPVEERTIIPDELIRAGECFVTNSLMGVMPVVRVGDAAIGGGRPGEITLAVGEALEKELEKYC